MLWLLLVAGVIFSVLLGIFVGPLVLFIVVFVWLVSTFGGSPWFWLLVALVVGWGCWKGRVEDRDTSQSSVVGNP